MESIQPNKVVFQIEALNKVFGDASSQETFKKYPEILKRVQNVEKNALEKGDEYTQKNFYYTEAYRSGSLSQEFGRL